MRERLGVPPDAQPYARQSPQPNARQDPPTNAPPDAGGAGRESVTSGA